MELEITSMRNNSDLTELTKETVALCTGEHLKEASVRLIELYQNQQFLTIQTAYRSVYHDAIHGPFDDSPAKAFLALIKSLHPDRLASYRRRLANAAEAGNAEELLAIKNLLLVDFSELQGVQDPSGENRETEDDFDFDSSEWAYDRQFDFDEVSETESANTANEENQSPHPDREKGFIEALMAEEPGLREETLTEQLLSSLEGSLDLSGYGIQDLDGLEFCKNLTELNLENNLIDDLSSIKSLSRIRSLFIGNNAVESIEDLHELWNLEELDLSFNQICDVEPLQQLPRLRVLNLVGCPVPEASIEVFKSRNILVIH